MGTLGKKNYLLYGDITKIAKAFSVTRRSVYNAINGTTKNPDDELIAEIRRIQSLREREHNNRMKELRDAIKDTTEEEMLEVTHHA